MSGKCYECGKVARVAMVMVRSGHVVRDESGREREHEHPEYLCKRCQREREGARHA